MTDINTRQGATDAPQPAGPKLYSYRVTALNGQWFDIASPYEWTLLWSMIVRDGYVLSAEVFVPYHAIATLVVKNEAVPEPGKNVVHLVHSNDQPKT